MRTSMKGLIALTLLSAAVPAFADEGESSSDFTVSGTATVVSDYRFRGISQTDKDFTVQGSLSISHSSGLYASVWGSGIDDYVAAGGDTELDLVVGFSKEVATGTTIDVGVLYYWYPGAGKGLASYDSDFVEPYASIKHEFGPATAKLSVAYAPSQSALSVGAGNEDNLYLAGDLSVGIPNTPFSLSGHLGHSFGPSYLTIGNEYTDWNISLSASHGPLTAAVTYVDTDKSAISGTGRDIAGAGVVFSLGVAF